jgi:ribosomal protein L5
MHLGVAHASLPVTVWAADGVRIIMSAEQQPGEGAVPSVITIVMSVTGVTTLHVPLAQAQAIQAGLQSLAAKVENIGPHRPVMSTAEIRVKTQTIREGRKVIAKRVVIVPVAIQDQPLISLSVREAKGLANRLVMEAGAIEAGVR